jgi:hypothetical protein
MAGFRFAQNTPTGLAQYAGAQSAAFASNAAQMRGRGPGDHDAMFGRGGDKFYAGQGGVETYPGCYGLPTYCGWQQVAGSADINARTAGVVSVVPTVSPFFEPKAVYLFGIDPNAPGTNLRFTVGAVTVGGSPQLAINTLTPGGGGAASPAELLSDVFNRSDEPLLVNWSVFSTVGLARELQISVFNLNQQDMVIFACIWGNAVTSLDCYA